MKAINQVGPALCAAALFVALGGCGGGQALIPPPSVTITASPSTIHRGETSILRWESTNADRVVESNFGATETEASGTKTVSPTNTTTYYITVAGTRGQASQSVTVTVGEPDQPLPPALSLTANPTTINAGASATLQWIATNADTVVESNFAATTLSGSIQVSPTATTTYYIIVSGPGGQARQDATVTVIGLNTPPRANFTVTPASGPLSTVFQFDASASNDDQDPATALEVRWDWEDDGTYNTDYSTTKTASYQYTTEGVKTIRLQVRDTSALTDATTRTVTVGAPPTASFTVSPTSGDVNTVFQFDASGCTDDQDPVTALQVHWDWENDGTYDTAFSTTKTASHQYTTPGTKTIKLEVKDTGGLTATATRTVAVAANQPPTASFTVTPASGDVSTVFQFDASACTDIEDAVTVLQVQWDWENDGTYDTAYSTTKTASHQYTTAATKTVKLQVKDTGGLTGSATRTVVVKVRVTISPESATVSIGKTQAFTATVTGSANTAVSWSVQEGASGGSVTSAGLYTAPNTAGAYHVVATSNADATVSATATVTVEKGSLDVIVS